MRPIEDDFKSFDGIVDEQNIKTIDVTTEGDMPEKLRNALPPLEELKKRL